MNQGSFIAVGGCHVGGHAIDSNPSFVQLTENQTGLTCILKEAHFPLKKISQLDVLIEKNDPEKILLQLGNYEFHASIKRLLKKKKKKKASQQGIINEQVSTNSSSSSSSIPIMSFKNEKGLEPLVRMLVLPFIWLFLLKRNRLYLKRIQEMTEKYSSKQFFILSPMPCLKYSDNYIRNKAGKFISKLLASQSNVIFIDLFKHLPRYERLYIDTFHLNATGHKKLGKIVSNEILKSRKDIFYPELKSLQL
jgi:hypothetical protein